MESFFLNQNTGFYYSFFNVIYFITIILTIIGLVLVFVNRDKLTNLEKDKRIKIRRAFGVFLLIAFILRRGSFVYYGVYDWRNHLDLAFCAMTNLVFIAYCFIGKKSIFNLCYYFAFSGPLLAILFPAITSSIFNYGTLNFFIIHHLIFIFMFIFLFFENYKYDFKKFLIAYKFIVWFVFLTYIFNIIFATNYNELAFLLNHKLINNNFFSYLLVSDIYSIIFLLIINMLCIILAIKVLKIINIKGVELGE